MQGIVHSGSTARTRTSLLVHIAEAVYSLLVLAWFLIPLFASAPRRSSLPSSLRRFSDLRGEAFPRSWLSPASCIPFPSCAC